MGAGAGFLRQHCVEADRFRVWSVDVVFSVTITKRHDTAVLILSLDVFFEGGIILPNV